MARPPKECEQPGCHNRHNARGMCKQHYKLWMNAKNDPNAGVKKEPELDLEQYWLWVKKELAL